MDDLILVGRVARAHGNKGQVIVNLDTDFAEDRFRAGQVVLVGAEVVARTIRTVRFHQGRPVIALDGIETMDDAEALAGAELKVRADSLDALPENTYYHHELIGCDVGTRAGDRIGPVTAVEGTMEMSRLVVAGTAGDVLIPLVADICVEVDVRGRRIVVDPPDGLIELNASGKKQGAGSRSIRT
jgi:16S rRNA processing protein RimM